MLYGLPSDFPFVFGKGHALNNNKNNRNNEKITK